MHELQQSTLKVYENQYWSRLITLNGFLPGNNEKHSIGTDMVPEIDYFYRINEDMLP